MATRSRCSGDFAPLVWFWSYVLFMITLGVILLVIGFIIKIPILWTIGIILAVIGLILIVLGRVGHKVGGRAHYF